MSPGETYQQLRVPDDLNEALPAQHLTQQFRAPFLGDAIPHKRNDRFIYEWYAVGSLPWITHGPYRH